MGNPMYYSPDFSPESKRVRRHKEMNQKRSQDAALSMKAEAAFRQAAQKVIQLARQTGTPVVVWEKGHIAEIPVDRIATAMAASESGEA